MRSVAATGTGIRFGWGNFPAKYACNAPSIYALSFSTMVGNPSSSVLRFLASRSPTHDCSNSAPAERT